MLWETLQNLVCGFDSCFMLFGLILLEQGGKERALLGRKRRLLRRHGESRGLGRSEICAGTSFHGVHQDHHRELPSAAVVIVLSKRTRMLDMKSFSGRSQRPAYHAPMIVSWHFRAQLLSGQIVHERVRPLRAAMLIVVP